jgi:hypothetical protein
MLTGKLKRDEKEYRAIPTDSSSSIKDFAFDRKKYYKKYVLGQKVEEDETQATIIGSLVDCLRLGEEGDFEKKFFMSTCVEPPTGAMLKFTEALYKHTVESLNDDGEVTRPMSSLLLEAYNTVKYDREGNLIGFKRAKADAFDSVVERWTGSPAEHYYKEIREIRPKGLTVVCGGDLDNAEKIAEELGTNSVTAEIMNAVSTKDQTVYNQLQIDDAEILGLTYKAMIDKVIVDHVQKKVWIYDLKCVWSVEGFYTEYYLKRKSYIQAYLYWYAVINKFAEHGYEVMSPRFIVCDSINYYNPLIYQLGYGDLSEAKTGFSYRDRKYAGVEEIIEDLKWAKENDIWNISRTNHLSNGIVNLKNV